MCEAFGSIPMANSNESISMCSTVSIPDGTKKVRSVESITIAAAHKQQLEHVQMAAETDVVQSSHPVNDTISCAFHDGIGVASAFDGAHAQLQWASFANETEQRAIL